MVLKFESHLWPNFNVHGEVFHDVDVVVVLPHIRHLHQLLILISLPNYCCQQDQVTRSCSRKWRNLKNDKMSTQCSLDPEGRILELKRVAILNVDRGVVHEHPKGWLHHRSSLLHSGKHHHLKWACDCAHKNKYFKGNFLFNIPENCVETIVV